MKHKKIIEQVEPHNSWKDTLFHTATLSVLALFFVTGTLYAGDAAHLDFIGFSDDGNYLAFEQYGHSDGSGFAYSEIILINVPENSFAYPAVNSYAENEGMTMALTRDYAMMDASGKIEVLGIVAGNTGDHVINHPTSDIDADPKYVRFYEHSGGIPGLSGFREYTLTLNEIEVVSDNDDLGYAFGPPKMLELILGAPGTEATKILQRDTQLPKRRSYALFYRIQDIYTYHDAGNRYIAVFINYAMPGFEGPDMRFMVITGKLDL